MLDQADTTAEFVRVTRLDAKSSIESILKVDPDSEPAEADKTEA